MYVFWPVAYPYMTNIQKCRINIPLIFDIFDIFKNSGIFSTFSTNDEIFNYIGSFRKAFAKVESKKKTT